MYLYDSVSITPLEFNSDGELTSFELTKGSNTVKFVDDFTWRIDTPDDLINAKVECIRSLVFLAYDYKPTLEEYKNSPELRWSYVVDEVTSDELVKEYYESVKKGYNQLLELLGDVESIDKAVGQWVELAKVLASDKKPSEVDKVLFAHNNW